MKLKNIPLSVELSAYSIIFTIFAFILTRDGGYLFAQDMRFLIGSFVFITSMFMMISQNMRSMTSIFYVICACGFYTYLTQNSEVAGYITYRGLIGGIATSIFLYVLTLPFKESHRFCFAIIAFPFLLAVSPFFPLTFLAFYPFFLIGYCKNYRNLRYFAYFGLFFCISMITISALHFAGYQSLFSVLEGHNYLTACIFFSGYFIYKLCRKIENALSFSDIASPIILTAGLFLASVYLGHHDYSVL